MNASLRDLKQHVDETLPPPVDVEDIVARGDARLLRRRAALAAGSASLAAAVIVAVVALPGSDQRSSPPVDSPTSSNSKGPAPTVTRPLTYTDDYTADPDPDIHWRMQSIQYGDRTLRPAIDATALDQTDDGLVMVAPDGGIHFTDGSSTERIGELTILDGTSYDDAGVKTSTSGSLAAWFTPEGRDRSLVVYDTRQKRLLTEIPRPDCVGAHPRRGAAHGLADDVHCTLMTVVDDRVYYEWSHIRGARSTARLKVLDVSTGTVTGTDATALAEDLRSQPRGFVKGDDYETGEVVNQDVNTEAVFFVPRGSSLELSRVVGESGTETECNDEDDGTVIYCYGGFDTSGRRLNLRLPTGYTPAESTYNLFQWLDDDRFAVMAGATHGSGNFGQGDWSGYGDILVCDIAGDRCTLAAPGPPAGATGGEDGVAGFRLVPHLTLPN